MKLSTPVLPREMSPNAIFGRALATLGQAMLQAAAILQGQSSQGFAPVVSSSASWVTVTDLVREFLEAKARQGRSDRYLRQLRVSLRSFTAGRARASIDALNAPEIEKWMNGQGWASKTARGYVSDVRTLFNYAVRRGYVARNPAMGVELPVIDATSTIAIHTPDQVKLVLDTARAAELDACRHLAVRYFAGLRSAEAHRIRESDLKLDQGLIEVPATKSKTRARRLVTIQPNLRAWLDLGGELRPIGEMTVRHVIRLSKVQWAHNVTRHSFVSYHLAQFNNAGKTALEAGHSEQMLFRHYRALVAPAAAAEFWAIVPAQ